MSEFWDGKILLVLPDDPKYAVKKVSFSKHIFVVLLSGEITWFVLFVFVDVLQAEEVRQVADSELGFQQVTLSSPSQAKTYLFVNTDRMVVGCLVAEHIRQV